MSRDGDAARERRWKARGHTRLTARISGSADDALTLLCSHYHLDRREVVQALLLAAGAHVLHQGDAELIAIMRDHRMSHVEAQLFRAMHVAELHRQIPDLAKA